MVEHLAPMVQQRSMAAFRVQGIQGVLYNRLTQGMRCTCNANNSVVNTLSPDGKASAGAINRVLTGHQNFGVSGYQDSPDDDFANFAEDPQGNDDDLTKWLGTLETVGVDRGGANLITADAAVGDNGQYSPDLDAMLEGFDMRFGMSDVSCPICFGASYVGGYSMFRGYRRVLVPTEFNTASTFDLPKFELSAGTHTVTLTLPRGAVAVDAFRVMLQDKVVAASFTLDGISLTGRSPLHWCDGKAHQLQVVTQSSMTHMEIQFALSAEPVYFEIPKLTRNADISVLEQQEPFQIVVSPDVPIVQSLDVITESQLGKVLIVQTVNPWNTRNRAMLGHECMVRVAQPQELWRILPFRMPLTAQKTTNAAIPSKSKPLSGTSVKGFTF